MQTSTCSPPPTRDRWPPVPEWTSPESVHRIALAPWSAVLSVWTCGGQSDNIRLRQAGYLPDTGRDADRVPVGLASAAIAAYRRPGGTGADPDCGAGTVLVE